MKKRIVALMLALVMLCTGVALTACSASNVPPETVAKKSAAELVNEATAKTSALDEISAVMKMEVDLSMDGLNMTIPVTLDIKGKDIKSDNMTLSTVMTMAMLGQEIKLETYQEGQWAYVVSGDLKYKVAAQLLENELNYSDSMLKELPEELLADVEPVTAEDGSQTVTISFPGEKFSEIYNDLIKDMNSDTGMDMGELAVSNAVVTITMADGYLTVCDVAFDMDMTIEGVTATVKAKATITYEDPGQPVTITPPEGYQDFELISTDLM